MNSVRLLRYWIILNSIVAFGCSKNTHKYKYFSEHVPKHNMPRMVYVEDQVNTLRTQGTLGIENKVYVEVRKKNGESESGKLIKIDEEALTLSRGFYYKSVNDSTFRTSDKLVIAGNKLVIAGDKLVIPKSEILILKVY